MLTHARWITIQKLKLTILSVKQILDKQNTTTLAPPLCYIPKVLWMVQRVFRLLWQPNASLKGLSGMACVSPHTGWSTVFRKCLNGSAKITLSSFRLQVLKTHGCNASAIHTAVQAFLNHSVHVTYRVFQKCLNRTAKITLSSFRLQVLKTHGCNASAIHTAVQAFLNHSVHVTYRVFQKCLNRTAKITLSSFRLQVLKTHGCNASAIHTAVQAFLNHSVHVTYRVFQKCLNRTAKITLAACRLLLLWESCQSGGATHSAVQALMKHSVDGKLDSAFNGGFGCQSSLKTHWSNYTEWKTNDKK